VTLYPSAHPPLGIERGRSPAPAVQDHQAWWWCPGGDRPTGAGITPGPSDSPGPADLPPSGPASAPCGTLTWQYAPGGWAVVEPSLRSRLAGDPARRLARQVAAAVRMERTPMRFGFTVGRLPASLRIAQTALTRTPQSWVSSLTLRDPADPGALFNPKKVEVSVVSPADPRHPYTSKWPNAFVNGSPAFVFSEQNDTAVQVYRSGYLADVEVAQLMPLFDGPAAVLALSRSVQVIPDETNWVTDPIR
jgi:hypothetical protein